MNYSMAKVGLSRLVEVGSYPVVIVLGFALYMTLAGAGWHVTLASYGAALVGVGLIALHEVMLPYRRDWRPPAEDVRTDALFLIVVQVALPYLLAITLVIAIAGALKAGGLTVDIFWPHNLPVVAQVAIMLLAADFMRYWLHRAFHRYPLMWRLHAVHHSPPQLYAINVGRFHPIEKSVQYAADTLPFALLAVSQEVLAAYFVFYALNGFFQHSNCRVYLGPLNYVVAGPELHRWHHSRRAREMNSNFGNNLIVWDTLFRTRFLPNERDVETIGLRNRRYPTGFLVQMRSPFVRELLP